MRYEFNASIRQWGREVVLPIPKNDVDKLRLLTEGNLLGERVRVTVEFL